MQHRCTGCPLKSLHWLPTQVVAASSAAMCFCHTPALAWTISSLGQQHQTSDEVCCVLCAQSSSETSDRPVLFVDASHSSSDSPQTAPSVPTPHPRSTTSAPRLPSMPDQATPASDRSSDAAGLTHQQGPPPGMGLRDWIKQRKKDSAAAGSAAFPSVQVFCPGGCAQPLLGDHPHPLVLEGLAPSSGPEEEPCSSSSVAGIGKCTGSAQTGGCMPDQAVSETDSCR